MFVYTAQPFQKVPDCFAWWFYAEKLPARLPAHKSAAPPSHPHLSSHHSTIRAHLKPSHTPPKPLSNQVVVPLRD
jgi:hypothetical protein